MKRALISIFLTFSSVIIIICFCRKINNKSALTTHLVLQEVEASKLDYDIKEDIQELSTSLQDVSNTFSGGNVIDTIVGIGKGIYYFGRFVLKMIVHVLTATINIMIMALRLCGFDSLKYIGILPNVDNTSSSGGGSSWFVIIDPDVPNFGGTN